MTTDRGEVWVPVEPTSEPGKRPRLMFRPEVGAGSPLWGWDHKEVHDYLVDVDDLPLSPSLGHQLKEWAWVGSSNAHDVLEEGLRLCRATAMELRESYEVVWDPDFSQRDDSPARTS